MGTKSKFFVDVMSLNEEVTGSCHLCVVKMPNHETIKFIVDCGLFQESEYYKYNYTLPFNPDELNFALITHNHTDHIGRLPLLAKLGFRNDIYTTELTRILMYESLKDSCSILSQVAKRNNTKPLYDADDLKITLGLVKEIPYYKEIQVHTNVKVRFLDNGHLIGASMILVKITYPGEEDINMLFTGDYSSNSTFFNVGRISKKIFNLNLTVIQESTYATTYTDSIVEIFEENILKAVSENKTIIVPVFSLSRAQEIMLKIKNIQDSGKLDKTIPVYLDGKLSIKYTNIYSKYSYMFKDTAKNFFPENFSFVDKELRADLITNTKCKIILTSSGMGSYGPAPLYINNYISSENALIHFIGYPAKGTLSRKLKNAKKDDFVKIGGVVKQKKCDIEYTTEFSSHAKLDEILTFLKQFSNINLLLVNHGEHDCKENLAKQVIVNNLCKDVAIESRSTFYRINNNGLLKELTTKFL
ncbi:MAG: MBL fold metallo-hydrolase [Clostridia bacterium]|nr:MBL fold metallo-hydrolase [Clostridia bacterium]MDD4386447.1 MBL fold metallo-hydrolase [Clostridia bacterium]